MASPYPARIPDITTPDPPDGLNVVTIMEHWLRLVEHVKALMDTLGVNPQGTDGTLRARVDELSDQLGGLGRLGIRGLLIVNDATTPTTKLVITCDEIAVEGAVVANVAKTLDLTVAGKDGITFTRAVNTWGHVWLGVDADLNVAVIFDASDTRAGLTLTDSSLAGYDRWAWLGPWRLNGSSSGNLCQGKIEHDWFDYDEADGTAPTRIAGIPAGSTSFSGSSFSLAAAVPPNHTRVLARVTLTSAGIANTAYVRRAGSPNTVGTPVVDSPAGAVSTRSMCIRLDASLSATPSVEWRIASAATASLVVDVAGFGLRR